jgi:hypothetical protein
MASAVRAGSHYSDRQWEDMMLNLEKSPAQGSKQPDPDQLNHLLHTHGKKKR